MDWKSYSRFREVSERKSTTSALTSSINKYFSSRSGTQKRLSIYVWIQTRKRRRHFIILQEASGYVDHDILTDRLHVIHYACYAILFIEDIFYFIIDCKSICFHDSRRDLSDQVMEENRNGSCKEFFHVSRLDDFNETAKHCRSSKNLSTIDEIFTDSVLFMSQLPILLWCIDIHSRQLDRRLRICQVIRIWSIYVSEQVWYIFHLKKLLSYVHSIKVVITKHDFISTSSTGAISGSVKTIMNDTCVSKNNL